MSQQAIPDRLGSNSGLEATWGPASALCLLAVLFLALLLSGCIDAPGDGVKVITVGASDFYDRVADFSGSGPLRDGRVKPDVLAPGVNVISTAPLGLSGMRYVDSFYAKESGTSLSTPVVAGVAALLLQKDRNTTPAGIKAALIAGARKINNSIGESYEPLYQGAGVVDAGLSYRILRPDVCAVMPDRWIVGRWIFSQDSSSPGVDVGADRDQKKIYAMAPGNDEWTTKFLFTNNCERKNVSVRVSGEVSDWITVMSLPKMIAANEQVIFGATVLVPNATASGIYEGSIDILDEGQQIVSVPVRVEVSGLLEVPGGRLMINESIGRGEWDYYCVDVPVGTRNLTAQLSWSGASNLDVFLLDPSGKSFVDERARRSEVVTLIDPISGKYIIAVHARIISSSERYLLRIEESVMDVSPSNLNFGSLAPGESRSSELRLENGGLPLEDLSFAASMENKVTTRLAGEVARDESWEKQFVVDGNATRLSLNLIWKGEDIDLDLDAYDPAEINAGWSYGGRGNSEVIELYNPPSGKWRFVVLGDRVPRDTEQPFELYVTSYSPDTRPAVRISGPSRVLSGTTGLIEVTVKAPSTSEGLEKRGHIELNSNNYSISVPISYTVVGASIKGISGTGFNDSDLDGKIDSMTIGVGVQAGVPGVYEVKGALNDCSGNMVCWVSNSSKIDRMGVINLDVKGSDVWLKAGCGPLRIGGLLLYNAQGDLIGRFNANESVDLGPENFQAPAAYFNGSFKNLSEVRHGAVSMLSIGVGVRAVKPGRYLVSASLQDADGYEVAAFDRTEDLPVGNHTVVVEFNARKFFGIRDGTRLYLRELTLNDGNESVDEIDEAWSSGEINFDI